MNYLLFIGYWSNLSMAFFVILGLWTIGLLQYTSNNTRLTKNIKASIFNINVISYIIFLTIIATFRLIEDGIGGSDSQGYIILFDVCNKSHDMEWLFHFDLLFLYTTKFLRLFTDDYHVYFFVLYGFNVLAYILFLIEFCPKKSNYIPCLLLVFLYWRSFCTLRSNTAIAVMMIALILLNRKYIKTAFFVALSSFFFHKMAAIFILFFPFYYVFTKFKLTKFRFVLVMIVVIISGTVLQSLFLDLTEDVEFNGAYRSYVRKSLDTTFWTAGWIKAFDQMLLGFCMWIYYDKIKKRIKLLNPKDSERLKLIWMLCLFDMMTIPINYTMGVWRGNEFFYLPRIVMWCEVLYLFNCSKRNNEKPIFNFMFLFLFISWMIFRFYNMWDDSNLMPYIFEPLYHL